MSRLPPAAPPGAGRTGAVPSFWQAASGFWGRYRQSRQGLVGLVLLGVFLAVALAAPYLTPFDPLRDQQLAEGMARPAWLRVFPAYRDEPVTVRAIFAGEDWQVQATPGVRLGREDTERGPALVAEAVAGQAREGGREQVTLVRQIPYPYRPPGAFSLRVPYAASGPRFGDSGLAVALHTPAGREFALWRSRPIRAEGRWYTEVIDSRDTPLKLRLGFRPFANLAREVFGAPGDYTLTVTLTVPGGPGAEGTRLYLGEPRMGILGRLHGVLGADHLGSDLFSQLLYGARMSLVVGVVTAAIAVFIGTLVGILSGYLGGLVDELLMRVADIMLSVPALPILIILSAFLGKSLWNIAFLLAAFSWMGPARLVRSQTLSFRERAFVEAAKAAGARAGYIMAVHILPNVVGLAFASLVLLVPGAILTEAALSFLGFGDPRVATWGRMLQTARDFGAFSELAWWWIVPPGLAITCMSLAFVFIGNTVDGILNPRLKGR